MFNNKNGQSGQGLVEYLMISCLAATVAAVILIMLGPAIARQLPQYFAPNPYGNMFNIIFLVIVEIICLIGIVIRTMRLDKGNPGLASFMLIFVFITCLVLILFTILGRPPQ